jgi:serine phosphatase RsbU (regulator of sigma subunit)
VPEPRFATRVRLDPGDTLLAFTDGLVEVRGEALDDGLRALVEALTGASARGLDEVVEGLVEDFAVRRGGDDDVTALAIRRHPAARE